jgi:oligosaccharide repeat unit polymerase
MGLAIYNMLFFLAVLIWYQRRKKEITVVSYVLIIWLISSIFSIFYVMTYGPFDRLALLPFLYLEFCLLISLYPIYKFDVNCLKNICVNEKMLNVLIFIISVAAIIPFFENLIHYIDVYLLHPDSFALYKMYINKSVIGVDKYDLTTWLSPVGQIGNSITLKIQPLVYLLLFYCLTRKKINKFRIYGLTLVIVNIILFAMLMSGRSTPVFFFLYFILFSLLFRKIISKKVLKKIAAIFLIIIGGIAIAFAILSIARFEGHGLDEHYNVFEWVSAYLGGGLVDFNHSMWNILEHTEGDRSFSFFKDLMGFDTYTEHMEFRLHWSEEKTNVAPHLFYTYIGDWYSDLGPYFTLLLTALLSLWVRKMTSKRNSISFVSLYVYVSFCYILLNGFTIYSFLVYYNTLGVIIGFIGCFILNINKN